MTNSALQSILWITLAISTAPAQTPDLAAPATSTSDVPFEELHRLIRQHLAETSDAELNAAAVNGLINQLKPHVLLTPPNTSTPGTNALVVKAERYRDDFGYLRVGVVRSGLRAGLWDAIEQLLAKGPLKGLILDLRETGGTDYAAAAEAASLFTDTTGTLLRVGDEVFSTDTGGEDVLIPVMTLTNGTTSGAAEALAAVLRKLKTGLIIGGRTAGQATLYESFKLSGGQTVYIASKPVQLGDGTTIPRSGLAPDLVVATTAEDDRKYLADPYSEADGSSGIRAATPRRRITEADLVRQRREGVSLQQLITNATGTAGETVPTLRDPALVRALDMLKGLTVVQTWKKAE